MNEIYPQCDSTRSVIARSNRRGQFQGLWGGAGIYLFIPPSLSNERHACMSPNEATQRFLFPR